MKKLFLTAILSISLSTLALAQIRVTGAARFSGVLTLPSIAQITYVSSASGSYSGASRSTQAAGAINAVQGNFFIVFVRGIYQMIPVHDSTVADTAGNTFIPLTSNEDTSGEVTIKAFYAHITTGNASDVVTVTFVGGTTTNPGILVLQYSAAALDNPFDTLALGTTNSTTDPVSNTFTTSWANDALVIGTSWQNPPKTASSSSGYTVRVEDTNSYLAAADMIVSSPQTLATATMHLNASATYTASVVVAVRRSAQSPNYQMYEGWENNNFDKWSYGIGSGGVKKTVNSNASYKHLGTYSGSFHYQILSGSGQDDNVWAGRFLDAVSSHIFLRGYVYMKTPEAGAAPPGTALTQRKLLWLDNTRTRYDTYDYSLFLVAWGGYNAVPGTTHWLMLSGNFGAACASGASLSEWDIAELQWNTWHVLELEVLLNTSGNSDGEIRLWVDGNSVLEKTAVNLRGTCTDIGMASVGRQTNQAGSEVIDEYRYWDDVVISNSYVGP